ncbi:MAG: hypothetical protein KC438_00570 [Thermomicrobiales bacterium]|nr:hypothetical protein [Thermomicrobiales bacterium]MCO5223490.1 hypothetical protein [Thermomicrobiales bacterium]
MTDIDLTDISGLPLHLDTETGLLTDRSGGLRLDEPGRRRFGELRAVVASPDAVDPIADEVAYLTYRDVRQATEAGLAANGLRYDVTVTLPGMVGGEYVKTAGHYHGLDANGVSWPEIYDVLFGEAVFVLQQAEGDPAGDPAVRRGIVLVASAGDRLVIPPNFGHVTVNIGDTPLVVADLVARASENHYQGYAQRRGGAVRVLAAFEENTFEAVWNPAYPETPAGIDVLAVADLPVFEMGIPLYRLGAELPDRVAFLTNPASRGFEIHDAL